MVQSNFEWDARKDAENQEKHGVPFVMAQEAFFDPCRVVARDLAHSGTEDRFYCMGHTGGGILTVRFTFRGHAIRIIGAGYWRKGKRLYEKTNQIHE